MPTKPATSAWLRLVLVAAEVNPSYATHAYFISYDIMNFWVVTCCSGSTNMSPYWISALERTPSVRRAGILSKKFCNCRMWHGKIDHVMSMPKLRVK